MVTVKELQAELETLRRRNAELEASVTDMKRVENLVREKTAEQTLIVQKLEEEILRRKESELELRTALEQLQGILDNSPSLIFVKDTEGRFLLVNRKFEEVHAIPNQQARGKSHYELFPKKTADQFHKDDMEVLRTARPHTAYEQLRDDKGVFVTTKFPLFNENGAVRGLCGIATDITEQKQIETELLAAKDAAEAASRSKSEFLANMSHELRTPLNGILGMTELMLSELPPEQLPRMEDIKDSASRLLKLINNILDISMIEADRMEISEYPLSLRSLGQSVLTAFQASVELKGVSLSLEIDKGLPDVVVGDEGRLRQVLENLTDNAVKFTEQGEVSLAIQCGYEACPSPESMGEGSYQRDFLFCVRDTGIGIALEDQEKIFDLFTQLDGALNRRYAGTGLGLTLCKKLACLMNGTIRMESTPGKGSEFSFTVPLEIQKEYFLASQGEG